MFIVARFALAATLALPVVCAVSSCSNTPAHAAEQRDSPPPKPMPPPQVVARKSTDPVFNAATIGTLFPTPTQELLATVRNKARREWRKDAVITELRYQWSFNSPTVHKWVAVRVISPGDGAQRSYSIGDIYDGQVFDFGMSADAKLRATTNAIADIKVNLREAMATATKLGFNGEAHELGLEIVGVRGKPRVPAWRLLGASSGLFPLTINAMTGGVMDWRDAYATPNWSDAEIAATFRKLFNVPPPRNLQYERYVCEDLNGGNWMPWDQCDR